MYAPPAGIRSVFGWSCLSSLVRGSSWSPSASTSERKKVKKQFGYPRKQLADYHTIRKVLTLQIPELIDMQLLPVISIHYPANSR